MKLKSLYLLLVLLGGGGLLAVRAADTPELSIRALGEEAELVDTENTTVMSHPKGVEVTYRDAVLTARSVAANKQTGEIKAEGTVRLQQGDRLWLSESLTYNFLTREVTAQSFRTGMSPIYVAGFGLASIATNGTYHATNAFVTTDDLAVPGYRIKARHVVLKPGEWIEIDGATFYLGKVPMAHLSHLKQSLKERRSTFNIVPGYNSDFGAYLLNQYNWVASERLEGAVQMDYRLKRGPGVGSDFVFDLGRWGNGELGGYYTYDESPGRDLEGNSIKDDRHRLNFSYRAQLRTNLTAKTVVRELSDPMMERDFFESEYRRNPQPDSFFELNQLWPNFSLNVLARPQIEDFFTTVERLPDIKFSAYRQQLGQSPFYYEGETSAAYLQYRSGFDSQDDFAAFRGDTFHQVVLPKTLFGWLNLTPRAGVRYTYYEEADGPAAMTDEEHRGVFNTGMEASTKISRTWKGAESKLLDISGLRHIVEPSVNYVYVPSPNVDPLDLPQFDTEFPSLRLMPIDFPDYNSIDSVDSQNVMRFSFRNRLQTKRDGKMDDLLNWALYTDWRLNPRSDQDTFADFYSDLAVKPRSWLNLISQIRYDWEESRVNLSDHYIMLEPNNVWSYAIGHRYMRDDLGFGPDSGHNLVLSRLFLRINENWGLRLSHLINAQSGELEEQYYTVYRDFRVWTSALTLRVRQSEDGEDDYTVAATLSLKLRPRYKLGDDKENPSLLLGR